MQAAACNAACKLLRAASAGRAGEPRGVIIYGEVQRYLPGRGTGRVLRSVDGKLNSNFLLHSLCYTPQSTGTPGSPA